MNNSLKSGIGIAIVAVVIVLCAMKPAQAQVKIGDIVMVKGQERQKLIGFGLLFGLDGTGDSDKYVAATQSLAMAMKAMGMDLSAAGGADALKGSRNVAVVFVEATLPPAGLMQGEAIECKVSAAGAQKSLKGGTLLTTALISDRPSEDMNNPPVYAYASGALILDDDSTLSGTIPKGCEMAVDMVTPMQESGRVTLLIDPKHNDWGISTEIAEAINARHNPNFSSRQTIAKAVNLRTVRVTIPPYYRDAVPVFISEIMQTAIANVAKAARVVVDERSGTVVIDPDVEINAAVFSAGGVSVEIGDAANYVAFDPPTSIDSQYRTQKLQDLVDALNAIKVPADRVITIIRALDAGGHIHGHVEYIR